MMAMRHQHAVYFLKTMLRTKVIGNTQVSATFEALVLDQCVKNSIGALLCNCVALLQKVDHPLKMSTTECVEILWHRYRQSK